MSEFNPFGESRSYFVFSQNQYIQKKINKNTADINMSNLSCFIISIRVSGAPFYRQISP